MRFFFQIIRFTIIAATALVSITLWAAPSYIVPQRVLILPYENKVGDLSLNYLQHSIASHVNIELLNSYRYATFILKDVQTARTAKSIYEMTAAEVERMAYEAGCELVITGSISKKGRRLIIVTEVAQVATDSKVTITNNTERGLPLFQAITVHAQTVAKRMQAKFEPALKTISLYATQPKIVADLLVIASATAGLNQSKSELATETLLGGQLVVRSAFFEAHLHPTLLLDVSKSANSKFRVISTLAGISLPVYLSSATFFSLQGLVGYASAANPSISSLAFNLGFSLGRHISNNVLINGGIQAHIQPQIFTSLNFQASLGMGYHFF